MKNNFYFKNKLFLVVLMIIIICISYASPYSSTGEVYKTFRTKRSDEVVQTLNSDFYGSTNNMHKEIPAQESVSIHAFDELMLLILSQILITFLILVITLSFSQLYLLIRRRNILVSQTQSKVFMVHYLQLKDGKKNALSFNYSY